MVGLPDERMGEIVAAIVTARGELTADLGDTLREHARQHLAPYKVPARWFVADELPVTPTGKVRKFAVVEQILLDSLREI